MANTIANSVMRLMVKPNICITTATPISDSGMVMIGMITARQEPKNKIITINTIKPASAIVFITSLIDSSMAIVESYKTFILIELGLLASKAGNMSLTSAVISSGFAVGAASIATTTASSPLAIAR